MKIITDNILARIFRVLQESQEFVFLDTSKPDTGNTQSLFFVDPLARLQFRQGDDEAVFLRQIQEAQQQGKWLAGWFAYEFGCLLEPQLKAKLCRTADRGMLLADLGVFDRCHAFDHLSGSTSFPLGEAAQASGGYVLSGLHPSMSEQDYLQAIDRILAYISAGDTYQVNYTLKLHFDFAGSFDAFYRDLRRNQSVGYGAYIRWGECRIMSFSPELFFRKDETGIIVRPMKGTMKRGRYPAEDAANAHFLRTDIKNISENVMIVDLLRNDLGRLMHHLQGGDVRVESLFDVEVYETLLQMTSTICGRTGAGSLEAISLLDFFNAIFPCGSVTGAPKIRTMEIIDELEKERRGVYTGAIGYLAPDGRAVFNVPIRTVVLQGGKGEMGIGSGIVHDSDPRQEWQECLLKGRFLTAPQEPFRLIETLLWQGRQGFFLLDEHLDRLASSARFFLFECDVETIVKQLQRLAGEMAATVCRVRLLLEKDGTFQLDWEEVPIPGLLRLPDRPLPAAEDLAAVALSEFSIDSTSSWYYHKTSRRELYNREFSDARSRGLFDKLFRNEEGNITEGCIANIIVFKDGGYWTPPLRDGLLDGVMRRHLLMSMAGKLRERSLRLEDLRDSDALFLCNSVRGIVQVALRD